MKELIKSNKKEEQYSEIEGYCEKGGDYVMQYGSYCINVGECGVETCSQRTSTQDEMEGIIF